MAPRSLPLRWPRTRHTQLCSASPRRTFSTLSRATRRFWPASPRLRVWRRGVEGSHQGGRRSCRRDRGERGAHGAERRRLRESSPGARTRCGFQEREMKRTTSAENKTLVIEAFDTLFNKRDYAAAERYWSPNYIQHSAHIEPGRAGLFNLIKGTPPTLKYEPGLIVADGEFVIVHGRFSNHGGPKNWIAADIVRIVDGLLVEHWDVLQDEALRTESKSG